MADQFSVNFDDSDTKKNKPIIANTLPNLLWRYGRRPAFVVVLVLIVLVLLCVVLAGLLGHSVVRLQRLEGEAWRARRAGCTSGMCLHTAGYLLELLNASTRPCDDLHRFACGGYRGKVLREQGNVETTVYHQFLQENEERFRALLNDPTSSTLPWSSERKLKDFYTSCTDDSSRQQQRGRPLIDTVFPKLGKVFLLDPHWRPQDWDLNQALKKVTVDLWIPALFTVNVDHSPYRDGETIKILPARTNIYMGWNDFISSSDKAKKVRIDYQTMMLTLVTLVSRDKGLTSGQEITGRIYTFVNDSFTVQQRLARIVSNSRYQGDAQKIALGDLTNRDQSGINWTDQVSYLFNEAGVTGQTEVIEKYPTYVGNLSAMIRDLGASRNRMLNNYLTWRALEKYSLAASYEYVYAHKRVYKDRRFSPRWIFDDEVLCFNWANTFFDTALSTLYVQKFFEKKNKVKVVEIVESLKRAAEKSIRTNTWMDKKTKDYAISKMRGVTYKIGYPDFLENKARVDAIYESLQMNQTNLVANLLAVNQHERREWNRRLRLRGKADRSEWLTKAHQPYMNVIYPWNEVIVPAGALQFPVYHYDMPHYYSFGAIGSLMGEAIYRLVDYHGRHWDKEGKFRTGQDGWWSNQTMTSYNDVKQCVADIYNNVIQGPYRTHNGETVTVSVNGDMYAPYAMSHTTGIRLAYEAYKAWVKKHGTDQNPLGHNYTPEQLFFIAHAQTFCYNTDPAFGYSPGDNNGSPNLETWVNTQLQQLPEFAEAFGCKAADKMVPAKRCLYD